MDHRLADVGYQCWRTILPEETLAMKLGFVIPIERSTRAAALIMAFKQHGLWPPLVPSVVLVECLFGRPDKDARTNQFLKTCDIDVVLLETRAGRAALLRQLAGQGSTVDAIVVTAAEPGGTVYTLMSGTCELWPRMPRT
jgi:hypothetical protein